MNVYTRHTNSNKGIQEDSFIRETTREGEALII